VRGGEVEVGLTTGLTSVTTLIACEAVFSCAYPVSNVSLQALRVSLVSSGMQGRVNATYRAVVFGFARF